MKGTRRERDAFQGKGEVKGLKLKNTYRVTLTAIHIGTRLHCRYKTTSNPLSERM